MPRWCYLAQLYVWEVFRGKFFLLGKNYTNLPCSLRKWHSTSNLKGNLWQFEEINTLVLPLITVTEYSKIWKDSLDQTLTTVWWQGTISNQIKFQWPWLGFGRGNLFTIWNIILLFVTEGLMCLISSNLKKGECHFH